ncbi:GNAT family N-acetyltransferase [Ligilactobacillus animalis]|uniref:GNAT family N-acetyltransferase n=1 Tax=Ligilactobacillus animalis TaxID=1605 RepID=UPI0026E023F4|nr:GNAT family N-acetyltransferase [Ligilactobacillus animalis]MDO5883874.1 GNAT family N-acetyltransferase [Ligilactobacillus animalis]
MPEERYNFELVPLASVVDFENLVSDFDCDNDGINDFLKNDCPKYDLERRLATFLLVDKANSCLAGFYSTNIGMLTLEVEDEDDVPIEEQHNYLNLAYLAVDRGYQGRGIGTAIIKEIFKSVLVVAYYVGIEMVFLQSLDESVNFYKKVGFQLVEGPSPEEYQANGNSTDNMKFDMFIRIDDLYKKGYLPYENNFISNSIDINSGSK